MPWSKVKNHADCPSDESWGVVKDDDGELEGCHATEDEADAQIAALYASEAGEDAVEPDAELALESDEPVEESPARVIDDYSRGYWRGVLALEGVETGDQRMFSRDALDWRELPLPVYWQERTAEGHDSSYVVGVIETIERDDDAIRATGRFDVNGEHGREAHRLAFEGIIRGLSVSLDDVTDHDVELVWPDSAFEPTVDEGDDEPTDDDEPMLDPLMVNPEKTIIHHGRITDVNFTGQPAMQEAFLELVPDAEVDDAPEEVDDVLAAAGIRTFRVVPSHDTATVDTPWDGGEMEIRLNSPLTIAQANGAYAWYDSDKVNGNDEIPRTYCKFIHHVVSEDGTPGAANLTACSAGIGILNGARGGAAIPASDRQGVYNHLAAHIRDGGREPPVLLTVQEVELRARRRHLVAATAPVAPPTDWFTNPKLSEPTPWTIEDSLEVFGHLALWGTCHTSFQGTCVTAPRETDYSFFTSGEIVTAEGERVPVGKITLGTGHAPSSFGVRPAVEHYDNTGYVAADVAVGTDKFGIWVHGAARPELTTGQLRAARSAGISGDWRSVRGRLRLIGALMVNVPGFPVPRLRTYSRDGEQLSLVASGVYVHKQQEFSRSVVLAIARSIGRDPETRVRELRARVHPSQQ